jgi:hypothetical protein
MIGARFLPIVARTQRQKTFHHRKDKLVLDALTGIAWNDDSQIARLHLYREYDRASPRIEISVNSL